MRLHRTVTVLTGLALVVASTQAATAEPATASGACVDAPAVSTGALDRRVAALEQNELLTTMIQEQGLGHWMDATRAELAQGLSDRVIEMMNSDFPVYPLGAPLPTYPPPLPKAHGAERPAGPNPNFDCPRSLAAFIVYSWWAGVICAMFEIGSTFLGGLACKAISGTVGIAVPWNDVCRMTAGRSEAPAA